ncbi:hypothetical protein B0H11DRAFT_755754 [Mycena galericulata]|nr:hypothetical protein B0H11DRAFT_755754 [Mycena galericulata]
MYGIRTWLRMKSPLCDAFSPRLKRPLASTSTTSSTFLLLFAFRAAGCTHPPIHFFRSNRHTTPKRWWSTILAPVLFQAIMGWESWGLRVFLVLPKTLRSATVGIYPVFEAPLHDVLARSATRHRGSPPSDDFFGHPNVQSLRGARALTPTRFMLCRVKINAGRDGGSTPPEDSMV